MRLPEEDIRIFNDSLDRLIAHPRSLDMFYETFIDGSEAVAAKFADTDMHHQKRALKASLYTAMFAADGNQPALEQLHDLGRSHRALDIAPEHYDLWLDCLIGTVRECAGTFDVRIERVWRDVLGVAIDIMRDEVTADPRPGGAPT